MFKLNASAARKPVQLIDHNEGDMGEFWNASSQSSLAAALKKTG